MEELICRHCHQIPAEEVALPLEKDLKRGLSLFEVKRRQEDFGFDVLGEKEGKASPCWVLAPISAATRVHTGGRAGFIQESKAENTLEFLKKMVTTEAVVIRDKKRTCGLSQEPMPGDLAILHSADKVPADGACRGTPPKGR